MIQSHWVDHWHFCYLYVVNGQLHMLNADSSHIKVTAEGPNLHLHAENILRFGSGQFGDNVVAVSTNFHDTLPFPHTFPKCYQLFTNSRQVLSQR